MEKDFEAPAPLVGQQATEGQPDEFARTQAEVDTPHPETQEGVGNNPTDEQGGRGPTDGVRDPGGDAETKPTNADFAGTAPEETDDEDEDED